MRRFAWRGLKAVVNGVCVAILMNGPTGISTLFGSHCAMGQMLLIQSFHCVQCSESLLRSAKRHRQFSLCARRTVSRQQSCSDHPEGIYLMERTFKVIGFQDTDLITATLLDQRDLKSTVEWEGQLSGKQDYSANWISSGLPTNKPECEGWPADLDPPWL